MARRNGQTLKGRISGAPGAYLGDNRNHSLEKGNKLASHKQCTDKSVRVLD